MSNLPLLPHAIRVLPGNTSKSDLQIKKRTKESLKVGGGASSARNDEESSDEDDESFMAQEYREEGDDDMGRQ